MKDANKIASDLREHALHWYLLDDETGTETTVYLRPFGILMDIVESAGYHDDPEDISAHEFLRNLANLIDRPEARNIAGRTGRFRCSNCRAEFDKGLAHFDYCPHCGAMMK